MTHQSRMTDAAHRLRAVRGISVTYLQGSTTVADLAATVGKTTAEQDISSEGGTIVRVPIRDYIIDATELGLQPRNGDVISEANGTQYEVRPLGSEPCWRWSDSGQTQYRIHTQQLTNL